jgi:hypothetical protein
VHVEIDVIGEWSGEAGEVPFEVGHGAAAGFVVTAGVAAQAPVAGRDEREARGKAQGAGGSADDHMPLYALSKVLARKVRPKC